MTINVYKKNEESGNISLIKKLSIEQYSGEILLNWFYRNLEINPRKFFFELINGVDIGCLLRDLDKVNSETDIREKRMKAMYYFPLNYYAETDSQILSERYFNSLISLSTDLKILSETSSDDLAGHIVALQNKYFVFAGDW